MKTIANIFRLPIIIPVLLIVVFVGFLFAIPPNWRGIKKELWSDWSGN